MVFIFLTIAINILIISWMPKTLSIQEIYVTWGLVSSIAIYTDLALGNILDLYDFGQKNVQFSDLIIEVLLPPSFAVLFLNYLPTNHAKSLNYILTWTVFAVGYEWLAVLFHFEKLKGWSPWYSIPIYFAVFLYLRWHLHFLRKGQI